MEVELNSFTREADNTETRMLKTSATWKSLHLFTIREHAPYLGIAVISSAIAGLLRPALASYLGRMFDTFSNFGAGRLSADDLKSNVSTLAASIMILAIVNWILKSVLVMACIVFGELQAKQARIQLFRSLLGKDIGWYETQPIGIKARLPRFQTQIRDLQTATSQPFGHAIEYSATFTTALTLAVYTSWRITLVTLATIPLVVVILSWLTARFQPSIAAHAAEMNIASKVAANAISSIEIVKAYNGQNFERKEFCTAISRAAKCYVHQAWISATEIGTIRFFSLGIFVQGFWYGSHLANSGQASAGDVLTCFWACLVAMKAAEDVMPVAIILEKGRAASAALGAVLLEVDDGKQNNLPFTKKTPQYCEGKIDFHDVSFAYPSRPSKFVLSGVNFHFPAGKTICVVGKSGSGKSTIGNLLLKFYRPSSGEIMIDGQDLASLKESWIRENVTLIQPHGPLFNETLEKNITMGWSDNRRILHQEIDDCVELAKLSSTIHQLPDGLNTVIGAAGDNLSGGQKQRVSIARARFREASILILDESTSALDYISRTTIMDNIRKWRKGKTTIVITHDISQIVDQDYVYMLEDGCIAREGYCKDLDPIIQNISLRPSMIDRGPDGAPLEKNSLYTGRKSLNTARRKHKPPPLPIKGGPSPSEIRSPISSRMPMSAWSPTFEPVPLTNFISHHLSLPSKKGTSLWTRNASLHQVLTTVWPNVKRSKGMCLGFGFVFALVHAACPPTFSWTFSQLLSTFYDTHNGSRKSLIWSLAILGIAVGDAAAEFFMHYLLEISSQHWIDALRQKALTRILDQSKEWFEKKQNCTSNLTSCLDHNAEEMRNLIGQFAALLLVAFAMMSIAIIWSLTICWRITLLGLCCGPAIYMVTKNFQAVNGKWERRTNDTSDTIGAAFVEALSDIQSVKALTLESHFENKIRRAIATGMKVGRQRAIWTGILFGGSDSMTLFATALIFWYGASVASSAAFLVKDVISAFAMLLFSISNVNAIIACIPQINQSLDTATRLLRLSHLPLNASHEHVGKVQISSIGDICFNKVNFRYPSRPGILALEDFSITIPAKSCTAIVGQSGSGKSTVASLILGLYACPISSSGTNPAVTIGGIDIRHLHMPTLRALIAIVPQSPTIFAASVRANITYGLDLDSPLNSTKNVRGSLEAVGIEDFVQSLPNGLETAIGEGGVGLSSGQVQRLVIARALCRRPKMLILDEATSALDGFNAGIVRDSMVHLLRKDKDLTMLIITHAKEIMKIADNIVVLETGSVVQQGAYEDLSRKDGQLREILSAGGFD